MKIIFRIIVTALALLACAQIVPGISVSNWTVAIVAAIVLGLLNLIVRPVLFILTLPITLLTLGLFTFVINAVILSFAASIVSGFIVEGFIPALIGSFVISVISSIGNHFLE
jgi:putative membrane protein